MSYPRIVYEDAAMRVVLMSGTPAGVRLETRGGIDAMGVPVWKLVDMDGCDRDGGRNHPIRQAVRVLANALDRARGGISWSSRCS